MIFPSTGGPLTCGYTANYLDGWGAHHSLFFFLLFQVRHVILRLFLELTGSSSAQRRSFCLFFFTSLFVVLINVSSTDMRMICGMSSHILSSYTTCGWCSFNPCMQMVSEVAVFQECRRRKLERQALSVLQVVVQYGQLLARHTVFSWRLDADK